MAKSVPQALQQANGRKNQTEAAAGWTLRGDAGEPVRASVSAEKASKVIQGDAELRSDSFFRAAFQESPIGKVIVDSTGKIQFANDHLGRLFGYELSELTGQPIEILVPDERCRLHLHHRHAYLKAPERRGMGAQQDLVGQRKDGSRFPIEVGLQAFDSSDGTAVMAVVQDISELKKAEAARALSEQQLNLALDAGKIGTWSWDLATGRMRWDDRLHAIFGVALGAFDGTFEHFLACLHPQDAERVNSAATQSLKDNTEFDMVYRVIWPDRSAHYVRGRGSFLLDDGKPSQMTGVCMDVTEIKELERQRQQAETRYRDLFDNAPDMMAVIDCHTGTVSDCNGTLARRLGRTKQDILGQPVHELYAPDDREVAAAALEKFRKTGDVGHVSDSRRLCKADGELIYVELNAAPVWDETGRVVASRSIWRDVTSLRWAQRELQEREVLFRTLVEAIPYVVWLADINGQVIFFNRAWQTLTGLQPELSLGERWADCVHPDDQAGVLEAWQDACRRGADYHGECRFRSVGGTYRNMEFVGTPVRSESGTIVSWVGVYLDVTERIRADNLAQSNAELEQFAYVASHDLQEPLRKIQAFAGRLNTKCADELSEAGRQYLQSIVLSSGRMRVLINDLLTLSRLRSRGKPFRKVELGDTVNEVRSDLNSLIEETSARLEVDELPAISADPTQMRQLMQNLIGNALKFRRPEVPPVVKIRSTFGVGPDGVYIPPNGEYHRVVIEDNGIGFEQKHAEQIFGVFERLHGRSRYEGTGIGLAVCEKIVLRHRGTIKAIGTPGEGACFIVTLPRNPNEVRTKP